MSSHDLHTFEANRPLMFSIAYRMLSSVTDAEDIIQEAYLRYQASSEPIESPKAFLSTIVTRLCLNRLQSAQHQREAYIGPWLPEPVLTQDDEQSDPAYHTELHESLSLAFLILLEQLTPLERAVFLLRAVFDYEYDEIAQMLDKTESACRQMYSRAKAHIAAHRPRYKSTSEAHQQLLRRFLSAASSGELSGLMTLLAEDVTMWTDGGGKARGAATQPLHGREAVARFVLASLRLVAADFRIEIAQTNGATSMILRNGEAVQLVLSIDADRDHIHVIRVVGNPDKLKWLHKAILQRERNEETP